VAYVVSTELERATTSGTGSKGGRTVGTTILDGFTFLQAIGMPIAADSPLAKAAAAPPEGCKAGPRRCAGSLPLKIQLQLETLAAASAWSVQRTIARCFVASCLVHHTRLNDALGTVLWLDDEAPDDVVRGRVESTKDGSPLELFAPAEGWLGRLSWLREHVAELGARAHSMPAFASKPAGKPSRATHLVDGVMTKPHARKALRDLLAQPPLGLTPAEFKELRITTHSPHGTGADMARFMGVQRGWLEPFARQLGHWMRDKNAPQEDPRRVPGEPQRGVPDGAPCTSGAMSLRYSQGRGRRGQRQEQLTVRRALVREVRAALKRFGRPWPELPAGMQDWEILLLPEGEGGAHQEASFCGDELPPTAPLRGV
jgi:hypothetical protein